jgi:hypothetical protein
MSHMVKRDDNIPSKADPRRGPSPGYAEDRPRDRHEARQDSAATPQPNPDEPGLRRDPDPPPRGKRS